MARGAVRTSTPSEVAPTASAVGKKLYAGSSSHTSRTSRKSVARITLDARWPRPLAQLEVEQGAGRVDRIQKDKGEGHDDRGERERSDDVESLPQHERSARRDREQDRRCRDVQFSRTTRSFTIRNPPASAMTTSTQPSKSESPSCGTVRRRTRSSTPVIMRIAPSDPRTGARAVTRIATPEEISQNAATCAVTPLGSSPMSGTLTVSLDAVRSVAKHAAVAAAATIVASQSRHPGSSPYVRSRAAT